jgi:hypothetical protein
LLLGAAAGISPASLHLCPGGAASFEFLAILAVGVVNLDAKLARCRFDPAIVRRLAGPVRPIPIGLRGCFAPAIAGQPDKRSND